MASPHESTALAPATSPASLVRALGVADLTWLYLVAVVNLNFVPVVAADGLRAVWLWLAAILCFFLPQGIAVLELAERMPGEGGLYLWAKETYGDFHGFMCGWCYWLTNMFFVPSLLFYVTGVTAYMGGGAGSGLGKSRLFFFILTNALLWVTVLANVRGLGVGKWVNNIGGIGALTITITLLALAGMSLMKSGHATDWSGLSFRSLADFPLPTLGVVCLAMVGLEVGPVMGDEVHDPRRTFPRSILVGGSLCALAYMVSTLSLAVAMPKDEMAVVQGMMQAIDKMSGGLGLAALVMPAAILMVVSIVGSTSAWVNGSARILFVSGLDRYLPQGLGKVHPRFGSPYVALLMFGALASAVITMSFVGAGVRDAYVTLLDLSVALQMISYLYLFASLVRRVFSGSERPAYFRRGVLRVASVVGFTMSLAGFATAFIPSGQISSIWAFELKMFLTLGLLLAVAVGLFIYEKRRQAAD